MQVIVIRIMGGMGEDDKSQFLEFKCVVDLLL
jgi:hypothetical protein